MSKPVSLSEGVLMTTDGPVALTALNTIGLPTYVGSGSGDCAAAVNAAMVRVSAAGGGDVVVAPGSYVNSIPISPRSGVRLTLSGVTITMSVNQYCIANGKFDPALSDFTVMEGTLVGPVNESPSVPQLGRTTSGAGMTRAIVIEGDLEQASGVTGYPVVTNISIIGVRVRNTTAIPILLGGIRGVARMMNCEATNCMDLSWRFCQEAICIGCHSYISHDNGISISRGVTKATVTGNTCELCAGSGIAICGFLTDTGPQDFTCTGNVIKTVGAAGIYLEDFSAYGSVVGNEISMGYNRGAADGLTDIACVGIAVRGTSATPNVPTQYEVGLNISGNTIRTAPRAGILIDGVKQVTVSNNLIIDTGTQFLSDGTTAILASDLTQNVGILVDYPTTVTGLEIRANTVVDTRGAPYCNWAIVPVPAPAGTILSGNTMSGCRNATNMGDLPAQAGATKLFTANGSYVVPNGISFLDVTVLGAGGGGGGGGAATGTTLQKGGGGGGAGAMTRAILPAPAAGTSLAVVVGAGGAGGAGGTANGGAGANGSNGGLSSVIGSGVTVYANFGTGGFASAGNSTTTVNGGICAGSSGTGIGTDSRWLGSGGPSGSTSAGPVLGSMGGGGGGTASATLGGLGGQAGSLTLAIALNGGAAGTAVGGAGATGAATDYGCGGGGGGGGAAGTGAGGAGGAGIAGWVIIRPVG
jgi:hypothetical protein